MEIVGIDFGTTNVRISTWDQDDPDAGLPQSRLIGRGDTTVMPVVVALQRLGEGDISIVVGEDADALENSDDTLVISNIKRWALSNDSYVKWRLEISDTEWPTWWNPEQGCVEAWGQHYQVKDLISAILKQAVERANLPEQFEWRAGCPVQSGYDYRSMLAEVITDLAGQGRVEWVIDEPVLFLAAAQRNIDPDSQARLLGSYLVYDLGGGSFDCALVDVRDDGEMVVFGADGDPLLGGSNVDRALANRFSGPVNQLRGAKEAVSPDNPSFPTVGGTTLTWQDVEAELKAGNFIQRSLMAMRDAYISARSVVFGSIMEENEETGEVRFVWQRDYSDMARDLDGIIMFGGPTRSPFFKENLSRWFGETKVMLASDLIGGVADPEITGVSMGACYFPSGNNFHQVPTRLPYQVALENTSTGLDEDKVHYRPHQHFVDSFKPAEQFESPWLDQDRANPQQYELTITDPDGVVLEQVTVDGYLEADNRQPATGLRLVIDRLGPVYVEKRSVGAGLPWSKRISVVENPPWQTDEQRERLETLRQRQRDRERGLIVQAQIQLEEVTRHPEP
jgi:hypothetical protein